MLWRMAWRNLWRHRTRTLIMGSAVAFTYGLMLAAMAMNDDGHARMLEEAAKAAGGDVLVHGAGYWETQASDVVLPDGDAVLTLVRAVPGVETAIPRVLLNALVSTSADSRPLLLQGIDPGLEPALRDPAEDLVAGSFLAGERDDPLVLGSLLAEKLEVEVGDRVVLTATDPEGEMTRALFHLTGIVETGLREADEGLGYTTVAAARRAVRMGGALTQIGIVAADGQDADSLAAHVRAAVEGRGLEVLAWPEAVPEMVGFVELDNAFGYIYLVVILAVVLFSITNTFLMAVMERVREFGLLNALGLRGRRIGHLLMAESVLMTALAMAAGFVLGFGAHLAVAHWGISMASMGVEEIEMSGIDASDMVIYSRIVPAKWVVGSVLVALATVSAALYPAWRATRLAPAEAMRFYE